MTGSRRWDGRVGVSIDPMGGCLAAGDVVGDVLHSDHGSGSGRDVHAGDLEAYPMPGLEGVRGRQNLDPVLDDLARFDRSDGVAGQLVKRLPGLGPLVVQRPIRRLESAARELPLREVRRHVAFPDVCADVDSYDVCALFVHPDCVTASLAARDARDEYDFSVQSAHHHSCVLWTVLRGLVDDRHRTRGLIGSVPSVGQAPSCGSRGLA
jgi:hypothetical protein